MVEHPSFRSGVEAHLPRVVKTSRLLQEERAAAFQPCEPRLSTTLPHHFTKHSSWLASMCPILRYLLTISYRQPDH
jgi:hypothetical protein